MEINYSRESVLTSISKEVLLRVAEESPMAQLVLHLENPDDLKSLRILFVNESSQKAIGLVPAEMIGKTMYEVFPAVFDRYPILVNAYKRALKGEKVVLGDLEYGDENIESAIFHTIIHSLGNKHIMITYNNVTEQRHAERRVLELNAQLEKRVEERTAQLEKVNKELQEFSYVAAHDLKAPVTNIQAFMNLLDRKKINQENGAIIYDKLGSAIDRLHKTIFSLNDVIALKSKLNDTKETIQFERIFNEVKESLPEDLEEGVIDLTVNFQECPTIHYAPLHLMSIMQNLFTNAIKYKSPDRLLKIDLSTTKSGQATCLTIKDNGLGFDSDRFGNKIYGLFTRLHDHVEGQGVGMYIINSIVGSNGGKIEALSSPDNGAQFKIFLNNG